MHRQFNLAHAARRLKSLPTLAVLFLFIFAATGAAQTANDTDANPAKLFEQGQDAHARGDYEQALRFYNDALALQPDSPEIEYQRGVALVSLKRPTEAEAALRRALALRAGWTLPRLTLGKLLADAGVRAKRKDQIEEAAQLLQLVLAAEPGNLDAINNLARLRFHLGDDAATLTLLRQATAANNANAEAWLIRAIVERRMNRAAEASASIERALTVDPKLIDAYIERADLQIEANDAADAAASLRRVAELQKERFTTRRVTVESFEESVRLPSLHARLGELLRRTDPAGALEQFRRALEIAPVNADYATGYAAALVQARRYEEAVKVLRSVIAAAPGNYPAHANLAAALDELKRYDEALVEYLWLRERRPDIAVTDFFIARAHDLLGDYPKALAAYETFLHRADATQHKLEIEKVNLRLPALRRQAKQTKSGK